MILIIQKAMSSLFLVSLRQVQLCLVQGKVANNTIDRSHSSQVQSAVAK